MGTTGNSFIDFVSELVYGDMGTAELGLAPPPGGKNHIHWTRDNKPNSGSTTVTGDAFLAHHLDYMLHRYELWHSKYFQPPVRPWDGQSSMDTEQSATVPGGGPLPSTTNALGAILRQYYNQAFRDVITAELQDEVKAPYSYRYWAFMRWASDLRRLVLGQPLFHVHKVFDADGTVLSEKDFADIYHQVHHLWHRTVRSGRDGRRRHRSSARASDSTSASRRSAGPRSVQSSSPSTVTTSAFSMCGWRAPVEESIRDQVAAVGVRLTQIAHAANDVADTLTQATTLSHQGLQRVAERYSRAELQQEGVIAPL